MRVPADSPDRIARLADGLTEDDVDRWVPWASLLHSNGAQWTSRSRTAGFVEVRQRAHDRAKHGRLGPKDLYVRSRPRCG